jgi:hypothetical protein
MKTTNIASSEGWLAARLDLPTVEIENALVGHEHHR